MEQIVETIKAREKVLDGKIRSRTGYVLTKVKCRRCKQKARVTHSWEGSEIKNKHQDGSTVTTRLHLPKYCKR